MNRRIIDAKASYIVSESKRIIHNREELVRKIETIIEELNKLEKDVAIGKVTGGVAGVVGSGLVIGGIVGSFFTFGTSLALTAVGAGVGVAGGVTGIGAAIAHSAITKRKLREIKENIEVDALAVEQFANEIGQMAALGGIGGVFVVKLFDALGDVGSGACRTASLAGRTFTSISGALAVVTLPIDLYTIISNSISIHQGEEHEAVTNLRKVIVMLKDTITNFEKVEEKAGEFL